MAARDDQFLAKLLTAFKIEADEHLRVITNELVELEKTTSDADTTRIVETIYRAAHSLKGAARSVNMDDIESVCQAVEGVFAKLKKKKISPSTELFDILHRAIDAMTDLLAESAGVEIQSLIKQLGRLEASDSEPVRPPKKKVLPKVGVTPAQPPAKPEREMEEPGEAGGDEASLVTAGGAVQTADHLVSGPRKERAAQTETVRIAVDKLDPLMRQVGEMVSIKLTSKQRTTELTDIVADLEEWKKKWARISSHGSLVGTLLSQRSDLIDSGKTDAQLAKVIDFLDWNQSCVKSMDQKIRTLSKRVEANSRLRDVIIDDLLKNMMNVLMLPCSSLLEIFPKIVRDLAREAGKEVNLEVLGADLEIDRRILDEMKVPLIHLVRNSIDHGIEKPEVRERNGKPRQGIVTISISQLSGNHVEMVVSDDGAGIEVKKVREAAAKRGIISDRDQFGLDGQDALSLVFRSEVSTSPIVSNISGRGLGLAIAREKVESLGGTISVATAPGVGASFRILLPVTLSTFRGILVNVFDQVFVVPSANVERVARFRKDSINTVGNRDTVEVKGRTVLLVKLGEILEIPKPATRTGASELIPALILRAGENVVAFSVDSIVQEQEILVKGLGRQLSRVRNVSGATVLGSGRLVPILAVSDLVKSAMKGIRPGAGLAARIEELEDETKTVLVVEDSITSRMLLKNILETSGYQVKTAVDGVDAWNALKSEDFDLVVSDIEMPQMDGFELTATIRADEKLSQMPVVLVTSRGSREDRERGIDVGANAYIVKGSFDQNNLLETIQRLV